MVRIAALGAVLTLCACGGSVESARESAEARPGEALTVDAADAGPAWCATLAAWQTSCRVDPLSACAARNRNPPATAFACGEPGPAPAGCIGFPSCTLMVYCCD